MQCFRSDGRVAKDLWAFELRFRMSFVKELIKSVLKLVYVYLREKDVIGFHTIPNNLFHPIHD